MTHFIVGDIHGCFDEFIELVDAPRAAGMKIVSVGDLIDRGPASAHVLDWFITEREAGRADFVLGNHEDKFIKWLQGRSVKISHGLQVTIDDLHAHPQIFARVKEYFLGEEFALVLPAGDDTLVVHAALRADEKRGGFVPAVALYGETTGKTDEHGYPERLDWAASYKGDSFVVHGHVPVKAPLLTGRVLNIDTGCVFGGSLTGYCTETKKIHSLPARREYVTKVAW